MFENERQKWQQMEKEALKKALDWMIDGSNGAIGDELEEILDYIYWEWMMEEMRRINELKQRRIRNHFNQMVDVKVGEIEDLND